MYKIYTTLSCGYCQMAKDLLHNYNMEYTEVLLDSPTALKEFKDTTKHTTVPQIYKDDLYVGGYDSLVEYIGLSDSLPKRNT